ncbi:MAG: hypothetical protein JSS86_16420 [Cyanobacteria bacterium SZAS LIN-2]|nr:hypothetical protein [Cyanobacteria bacterium SZAS LIN-2]MBS2008600.1 hypothetical protein [Cyanobacteria bacterium SZAS TMP-1]
MNNVRFIAVALVFAIIAVISLWLVWSPNEHPSAPPPKAVETSQVSQSVTSESSAAPPVTLNSIVPQADDDYLIKQIYGQAAPHFAASGKIFLSTDYEQGGKTKHIFISSAGPDSHGQSKYTAVVLVRSGSIWLLESKIERPCSPTTTLRWRKIGEQNYALIEKTTTTTDRGVTVKLGVYTLAGQSAQPLLEVARSAEKEDTLDLRIAFKKSEKTIWSAIVITMLNNERTDRQRYFYSYGAYLKRDGMPRLSRPEAARVRGLEPTMDEAD